MMRHVLALLILLFFGAATVAQDQVDVVFLNSDPVVAVHSNFRGQTVTLFGSIEPRDIGNRGPFSVVVLLQGPSSDWVLREKARQAGLVLNSVSVHYDQVPSYYAVLSSSPLGQIVAEDVIERQRLSLFGLAAASRREGETPDLDADYIRLMRAGGNFVEGERSVVMHSATTFSVRVPVASNAANGLYLARALVISNGQVVGETTTRFTVRTQGFERYIARLSRTQPALYGLATVLLALATGWLGGVLFKR